MSTQSCNALRHEVLKRIQNSWEIGRRMISSASENEASDIERRWVGFLVGKDNTAALVSEAQEKLKSALQAAGTDVQATFSRRYVVFEYRGSLCAPVCALSLTSGTRSSRRIPGRLLSLLAPWLVCGATVSWPLPRRPQW